MLMFGYDYVNMNIFVTSQVTKVVLERHFIKLSRIFEEIPGGANENQSEPFFRYVWRKSKIFP